MWELDYKEIWAPKNWCFWTVVLEKTLESPLDSKEIQPVHPKGNQSWIFIHWKDWCWSWNPNNLATWCKELTPWKRPWCWERLKEGGEGDERGWDGLMASLTWWTWVWSSSESWWWSGKPGMLQSIGLQRVRHDWVTELNWTDLPYNLENPPGIVFFFCDIKGFPDSSVGKESTCNVGDAGLIPGSGRSPREGTGYPR